MIRGLGQASLGEKGAGRTRPVRTDTHSWRKNPSSSEWK